MYAIAAVVLFGREVVTDNENDWHRDNTRWLRMKCQSNYKFQTFVLFGKASLTVCVWKRCCMSPEFLYRVITTRAMLGDFEWDELREASRHAQPVQQPHNPLKSEPACSKVYLLSRRMKHGWQRVFCFFVSKASLQGFENLCVCHDSRAVGLECVQVGRLDASFWFIPFNLLVSIILLNMLIAMVTIANLQSPTLS
eukprot:3430067-Amphidinium_carterae.1